MHTNGQACVAVAGRTTQTTGMAQPRETTLSTKSYRDSDGKFTRIVLGHLRGRTPHDRSRDFLQKASLCVSQTCSNFREVTFDHVFFQIIKTRYQQCHHPIEVVDILVLELPFHSDPDFPPFPSLPPGLGKGGGLPRCVALREDTPPQVIGPTRGLAYGVTGAQAVPHGSDGDRGPGLVIPRESIK